MLYVWLAIGAVALVLEICTSQFVSIWFTVAAAVSAVACALGADTAVQIVIFVVISVILIGIAIPFVKKNNKKTQKLNADSCIGQSGIVTQAVDNMQSTGPVKVGGSVWSARSADGTVIPEDCIVVVDRIEGVKAVVLRKDI
ncbi:MAG: NfeD family protein [Clostridiales bacterium]|nr:NfeD family protein [Clostridiales bacterium]